MPVDSNIALQVKPITLPDPVANLGNALQLQNAQQRLQINALSFDQQQQTANENNALRSRISSSDFAALNPKQQVAEIQRVAPIAGQPLVDKMLTNRKTMADTASTEQGTAEKGRLGAISAFASADDLQGAVRQMLDGVKSGAWQASDIAPMLGHIADGSLSDQTFSKYQKGAKQGLLNPQQLLDATTQKPEGVDTAGGKQFVNVNPNAGAVGSPMSPVIVGSPKLTTGAQGEQLAVRPDGSGYGPIPASGAMPTASAAPGVMAGGPGVTAPQQASRDSDRLRILQQERALSTNSPADNAAIDSEIARVTASQASGKPFGPQGPSAGKSAGGFPTTVPAAMITQNGPTGAPGTKNFNAEQDAKNAGAYQAELNDAVNSGRNLMQLNTAFQDALTRYKSGPSANARLSVGKALTALGVKPDVIDQVVGGQISDAQEIQKLGVIGTLASLRQANQGGGTHSTTNRTEYANFAAANPSIETDPGAIEKIQAFQAQQYQRNFAEQQALADYRTKGGDPSRFAADYSRLLDSQGLNQPAMRTDALGTPGAAPSPAGGPVRISSDADYQALPSGAKYTGPDGHTRVKR